jgi:hypothetical protein
MQVDPDMLSRSVHALVRLNHEPLKLLQALDNIARTDQADPFLTDLACCTKICWCMATFGRFKQVLYVAAMAGICRAPLDAFSLAMRFQIVASILLAQQNGWVPLLLRLCVTCVAIVVLP